MDDRQIVALFFQRSEDAVKELAKKYGKLCLSLAKNIIGAAEDAEEVVSDVYHAVWTRIPPEEPQSLTAYLTRIVRNLSYSKLDYLSAAKRSDRCKVSLSELEGCLPAPDGVEEVLEAKLISAVINGYLSGLDKTNRVIFVRRYYYMDSSKQIGKIVRLSPGAVDTRLSRMRKELKIELEKEGITV